MLKLSYSIDFTILAIAMMTIAVVSCGSGSGKNDNAGIEIGNPSITVSAEFQVVGGVPSYQKSSKLGKVALSPEEVSWRDLKMPLHEVRYFASYYYYMPTDPKEGALLWPTQGVDTLLPMNVLTGDTLVADFQNMDIPSRSYLKEVGLKLDLSNWKFVAQVCGSANVCSPLVIQFPDSLFVDVRYHHSQMERDADTLAAHLPIHFHPQVLLSVIDAQPQESADTIVVDADSTLIEAFCQSFNGLRYFYKLGSKESNGQLLPAAAFQFDSIGVQLVENGDYSQRGQKWIFLTQEGGLADTSFEKEQVKIAIPNGGKKDFAVQWMQEDIELIEGRWYRLTFTAWADVENSVLLARVGRFHAPYDNLDKDNEDYLAAISTVPKDFSFEFCAKETNMFGRLEFNAGLFKRNLWIKNVSLIQIEE